mmetsp:Transcript_10391/g.20400  ORF Transcript_10391/g.20400 Transcript_10391/m.20400 type:complete len:210 (+) Transcript_10391:223-852(+)
MCLGAGHLRGGHQRASSPVLLLVLRSRYSHIPTVCHYGCHSHHATKPPPNKQRRLLVPQGVRQLASRVPHDVPRAVIDPDLRGGHVHRDHQLCGGVRRLHPHRHILLHRPCPHCALASAQHPQLGASQRNGAPEGLARGPLPRGGVQQSVFGSSVAAYGGHSHPFAGPVGAAHLKLRLQHLVGHVAPGIRQLHCYGCKSVVFVANRHSR